ncbi:MAG: nucleotidyltransferase domain-containing protein [Myxococcota bacterium]|nr:nucleotidyltransferase domain-containing protein [Myxococcota bacterium]
MSTETGRDEADLASYIRGLRERARAEEAARVRRGVEARSRLPEILQVLCGEFGARHIVLFGSLATGGFHETSDIDLLVDGVPADRWFEADARVATVAAPFEVDLVPRSSAWPSLIARADGEGEVLHDAGG